MQIDQEGRQRFESAFVRYLDHKGVDTSTFAQKRYSEPQFLYAGMPSEWRANIFFAHEALEAYEKAHGLKTWAWDWPYHVHETLCALVNAMKRSDYEAFNNIMEWAAQQYEEQLRSTSVPGEGSSP